jgi:hypothetical protein
MPFQAVSIFLTRQVKLGLGIALLPSFLADPAISARELISLNVGGTPTPAAAIALFPRSRNPSVAVRRLLEAAGNSSRRGQSVCDDDWPTKCSSDWCCAAVRSGAVTAATLIRKRQS